jgi:MoaD family protein
MQVRFYANLRELTKLSVLDISDPKIDTPGQLIEFLVSYYPNTKSLLLDQNGELPKDVPIFVNGRNPRLDENGLNQLLDPKDVISIFSPIASGRMSVEGMRAAIPSKSEEME